MIPVHGDRIVFLGDSITEQQLYTNYVEAYLAARFPKLALTFANAGWGGDSAPGGAKRLARDVLALKPTLVTVCYGMNDGRYTASTPAIVADYEAGLRDLLGQLKAAGVRAVVLTPGVVDYDRNPIHKANDYNRGLRVLADSALRIAAEAGVPGYDLHRLMLEVQTQAKAADPSFTMIPDAVHPDPAGQLVMAFGLLEALGVPPRTVAITVDAAGRTVSSSGVRSAKARHGRDVVAVNARLESPPFAIDALTARILPFLPFRARFDDQILRVTGLDGEHWQLRCDGQRRAASRAELERGIHLADIPGSAPQRTAAAFQTFTDDKDRMFFLAWRKLALQGANGPVYHQQAHRIQADACRRLDRVRDRILLGKDALSLSVSLVRSESGADLVADGDFLAWWHLKGPLPGKPGVDHLGGEGAFSAEPRLDPGWTLHGIDINAPGNNLNTIIGPAENCVAYALAEIDSPVAQEAELRMGSDDGCAAWLNGAAVISNLDVGRGYAPDQERAAVQLRAGRNHLLVKIGQFGGNWGFAARFTGLRRPVLCRHA